MVLSIGTRYIPYSKILSAIRAYIHACICPRIFWKAANLCHCQECLIDLMEQTQGVCVPLSTASVVVFYKMTFLLLCWLKYSVGFYERGAVRRCGHTPQTVTFMTPFPVFVRIYKETEVLKASSWVSQQSSACFLPCSSCQTGLLYSRRQCTRGLAGAPVWCCQRFSSAPLSSVVEHRAWSWSRSCMEREFRTINLI